MTEKPWTSGPREILQHAFDLLASDNEAKYRIAFILIDNAVELILLTYLKMPSRETGLEVIKKELNEAKRNFYELIKMVESKVPEKLNVVAIGNVEYYHRLRNHLYHEGDGFTIKKVTGEKYLDIALCLFKSFFGYEPDFKLQNEYKKIIEFFRIWTNFEKSIIVAQINSKFDFRETRGVFDYLIAMEGGDPDCDPEIEELYEVCSGILNGEVDYRVGLTEKILYFFEKYTF
jgi:hypothetical protein